MSSDHSWKRTIRHLLPAPVFHTLRKTWWRALAVRREGPVRSYSRWRLWSRILSTPPVVTGDSSHPSPVAVYLMCCEWDYLAAIWTLKSFYHFSRSTWPLVIHLQGEVPQRMRRRLRAHFPQARLIEQDEADGVVKPSLLSRGLRKLAAARQRIPQMQKLTDIPLMAAAREMVVLDSDVLFFANPVVLTHNGHANTILFQQDFISSYAMSPDEARRSFGIDLRPRLNYGLVRVPRDCVDLERCERFMEHPAFDTNMAQIEQTLWGLLVSQRGVDYLPSEYVLSPESGLSYDGVVARHYVGPVRHLMTEEGMARLVRTGFLK